MAKKITKKQARKETAAAVENALEKYLSAQGYRATAVGRSEGRSVAGLFSFIGTKRC